MSDSRKRTSELWQFFTYIDSNHAKCDACHVKISHKTTMSNLKKHMERRHPLVNLGIPSTFELPQVSSDKFILLEFRVFYSLFKIIISVLPIVFTT